MEEARCIICGSIEGKPLFQKASRDGTLFTLVKCGRCGLTYVSPRPALGEIGAYYSESYFMKRTDRGYDNYFSETTRREIERVIGLNLRDLVQRGTKRLEDVRFAPVDPLAGHAVVGAIS